MKSLYVTEDMKKWQELARRIWQERKAVDAGKVLLGWNLRKGTVIIDTAKNIEIELMENPGSYPEATPINVKLIVNGETKPGRMSTQMLAKIILVQPCKVYYSR